jgi:ATP-dependent Clp protease protease subunit
MKLRQMAMTIDGQRIRQLASASQDGETLNLYIYDVIEGDGVDWWTGEKTESETSAAYFGQVLSEHPDVKQINLFVNSRGGSVIEAMGIRHTCSGIRRKRRRMSTGGPHRLRPLF